MAKRKALMLVPFPFYPADGGGRIRVLHHVQSLKEIFDLTVVLPEPATQRHKDGLNELAKECKIIRVPIENHALFEKIPLLKSIYYFIHVLFCRYPIPGINAFYKTPVVRQLIQEELTFIQLEHSWWYHPVLKKRRCKLILDEHNYEAEYWHDLGKSLIQRGKIIEGWFYQFASRKIAWQEKEAIAEADRIFTVSDRERDLIRAQFHKPEAFSVMNSVDVKKYTNFCATYSPAVKTPETIDLVYVGSLNSPQTAEGAVYFIKNVFPQLKNSKFNFKLYLVGRDPLAELQHLAKRDPQIILTGYVDDVRPFIADADIYIVPLRYGSGTRIKIMEAMAMGKAIISTQKGAEGLDVSNGGVALTETIEEFTQPILELAADRQLRDQSGEKNRLYAQDHFDWEKIFQNTALPLYTELIG